MCGSHFPGSVSAKVILLLPLSHIVTGGGEEQKFFFCFLPPCGVEEEVGEQGGRVARWRRI